MPTTKTAAAKMTAAEAATAKGVEIIAGNGFERRSNAYAGTCVCCKARVAADAGRIVRPAGTRGDWELLCKTGKCTRTYFYGSISNADGTDAADGTESGVEPIRGL